MYVSYTRNDGMYGKSVRNPPRVDGSNRKMRETRVSRGRAEVRAVHGISHVGLG